MRSNTMPTSGSWQARARSWLPGRQYCWWPSLAGKGSQAVLLRGHRPVHALFPRRAKCARALCLSAGSFSMACRFEQLAAAAGGGSPTELVLQMAEECLRVLAGVSHKHEINGI